MIGRRFTSEGIVLSRKNYGEGDRIITLFSKNFGKISLLAKGIRKPKSRKRGHLEIFSQVKFSASKTKGMPILTEAELVNYHSLIRNNLKKVSVSYFMMEVISRVTEEEEKNKRLYDLILDYLKQIESSKNLKRIRLNFVRQVVTLLGFWPLGKELRDPDKFLEIVTERKMLSSDVAKKILRN